MRGKKENVSRETSLDHSPNILKPKIILFLPLTRAFVNGSFGRPYMPIPVRAGGNLRPRF
jgi:hypothetical protein